jgi:hypothetical protein
LRGIGFIQTKVGFGQVQFEEVFASGEMERAGFRQAVLALFEEVGDILRAEGLEFERVLDGSSGHLGAVNLAEGNDLSDVMEGIEASLLQFVVEGLGVGGEGEEAQEELLFAGPPALLQ